MSERDDRNVRNDYARNDHARGDLPRTTAEFRAAPDASASTAEFRAFASGRDIRSDQRRDPGSWPEQPWSGDRQARGSGRMALLIIGVVVVVAILVAVFLIG